MASTQSVQVAKYSDLETLNAFLATDVYVVSVTPLKVNGTIEYVVVYKAYSKTPKGPF